jgi:hypothetical protein
MPFANGRSDLKQPEAVSLRLGKPASESVNIWNRPNVPETELRSRDYRSAEYANFAIPA